MHVTFDTAGLRTTEALPTINDIIVAKLGNAVRAALAKENVHDLTPIEKVALGVAAGVPYRVQMHGTIQHIELQQRIGLLKVNGIWQVVQVPNDPHRK